VSCQCPYIDEIHGQQLARSFSSHTRRITFVVTGKGANKFAAAHGVPTVAPETLVTAEARAEFESVKGCVAPSPFT